jgi:HAD superfamily hydrolase (TIGR01459 family)
VTAARGRKLGGVAELCGQAELFLVDQFGTLHDGSSAYSGAAAALHGLRAAGARVVLLSNSGKRAAPNEARLARLGFPRDSYDLCLTSGEVGWRMLADMARPGRCLLLSRGDDRGFLDGLAWRATRSGTEADLVIIAGSEADRRPLEEYATLLRQAAERGVPCLCTNPDRLMLVPGGLAPGAACIAEIYESLGGTVTWIGKPHPAIYASAFAAMGVAAGPGVIGIGDSLEHDIAGAARLGCRTALVRTGIAATTEITGPVGPDFVLESFRW